MGRLIDADILIAELKESASHHCNNPREDSLLQRDRVIVRAQPTVEAIPKADYKNRLKADMAAMLTDIQLEIEELDLEDFVPDYQKGADETREYIADLLQQKIDTLKGNTDGT